MLHNIFSKGPVFMCFGGGGGNSGGDGPSGKSSNSANAGMGAPVGDSGGYHSGGNTLNVAPKTPVAPVVAPPEFISGYTNESFASDQEMQDADRVAYNASVTDVGDFDSWIKKQGKDVRDSGYGVQHKGYKKAVNSAIGARPEWMAADDADIGAFADYDPGLHVVGADAYMVDDGKGSLSGSYRNKEEVEGLYNQRVGAYLNDKGYGNLVTDPDNMTSTDYADAYSKANARMPFRDQITDLGYGDTFDSSTTAMGLEKLWADVQERDRYKGLLDDMGYEYDPNDNATGLGLMYGQASAIEDVKSKLEAAKGQYAGLEGTYAATLKDMEGTQGQFDDLFSDYGSLSTNYGDLQGTYDALSGTYGELEGTHNATKDQLGKKAGEYDTLSGLYDTLTNNYGTVSDDYNAAIGSLGELQGNYDTLDKNKAALQGTYDDLFGSYGDMTTEKNELQGDYDALTNTQAMTLEDLAGAQAQAQGVRGELRANETNNFLAGNERDYQRRVGQVQAPTQPQYTQARDALGTTGLDASSYQMAPLDFTSGFDSDIFDPLEPYDPAAYGATDYTNLAAPTQMGLPQQGMNFGKPFNPYFDALNQQYGVDIPASNYGLPPLGGTN